ncbi:MAG: hypothetical protein CV088_22090 [Nitrospira sp. LK70]|nr:hypothetical protein [Nitrospira sp. LK70]
MHLKRIRSYVLGLLLLVGLFACSDGGDTSTPSATTPAAPSAEGLWTGTTDTNRTVTALVLDNGVYWALYIEASNPSVIAGVVQGDSSSQNGAFTSSNARDFNLQNGTLDATINGSYVMKQSLNGTIAYQNNTQATFTMTYGSDYDLTPDMNAVVGTYTGLVTASETVTVIVSTDGLIGGNSSTGCTFSGSFSPRTHGNVFDVTITFHGEPGCTIGTEPVNGIAFYDAGTKHLYSAALNGNRTDGFVFIGTKS